VTPSGLLGAALDLLERPATDPVGGWPRAVALLTRQALEQALDEFWQSSPATAGMTGCTMKTQLTCLHCNLEPDLAREIGYIWAALSNACHYHPYDLAPTAAELCGWIDAVATLLATINAATPGVNQSDPRSNAVSRHNHAP
jgi:hypothetical protein